MSPTGSTPNLLAASMPRSPHHWSTTHLSQISDERLHHHHPHSPHRAAMFDSGFRTIAHPGHHNKQYGGYRQQQQQQQMINTTPERFPHASRDLHTSRDHAAAAERHLQDMVVNYSPQQIQQMLMQQQQQQSPMHMTSQHFYQPQLSGGGGGGGGARTAVDSGYRSGTSTTSSITPVCVVFHDCAV